MYQKIMVPLDGSELAECVLPHVKRILEGFPECKVVFVRVIEPIPVSVHGETYSRKEINLEERESGRKSDAKDYLKGVIERFGADGSTLDSEVLVGKPADSLADCAENNNIDLILIATHGRSGVSRWVRGSVADKVLRSSRDPVLMVRAPGTKGGI